MQNVPVELREGATLRFAASSRDYELHHSAQTKGASGAAEEQSNSALVGGMKRPGHNSPGTSQEGQVLAGLNRAHYPQSWTSAVRAV